MIVYDYGYVYDKSENIGFFVNVNLNVNEKFEGSSFSAKKL